MDKIVAQKQTKKTVGAELSIEEINMLDLMIEHDREKLKKNLPESINVNNVITNSSFIRDLINKEYKIRYRAGKRSKINCIKS